MNFWRLSCFFLLLHLVWAPNALCQALPDEQQQQADSLLQIFNNPNSDDTTRIIAYANLGLVFEDINPDSAYGILSEALLKTRKLSSSLPNSEDSVLIINACLVPISEGITAVGIAYLQTGGMHNTLVAFQKAVELNKRDWYKGLIGLIVE